MSLYDDAIELFGEQRNLTKEEQDAMSGYLESISVDTGINIFDENTWNNKIYMCTYDKLQVCKDQNYISGRVMYCFPPCNSCEYCK